jgi:uncharacterized protein YdeI (YjbR/CyaY-like superfamily)
MLTEPVISFRNRREWKQWLEKNHGTAKGVWLSLCKKSHEETGLTHPEALDLALCYGWIDGQRRAGGQHSFLQRFVPRARRSIWSKVNQGHVQRLIEAGEMHAAGLAEIERAKTDGRWEAAYEPQSRATVPADLEAALDGNAKAKAFFTTLSSQNRYAILFRLQLAKKPETRARKIQEFITMFAERRTFH